MKKILVVISGLVAAWTFNLSVSASAQENNDTNKVVATGKKQATWNKDFSEYEAMAKAAKDLANAGKMAECTDKFKELIAAWDQGTQDFKTANHRLWFMLDEQMDIVKFDAATRRKDTVEELDTFLSYLAEAASPNAAAAADHIAAQRQAAFKAALANDKGNWNKDLSKYEGMARAAKDLANAGKMAECFDKLRELHKNAWPKGARDLMNANHKAWALIHWQIANATIQAVHHYQKETIAELDTLLSYFAEVANSK